MWQSWVNAIIGLILLVIALMGSAGSIGTNMMVWLVGIGGLVVAVLGFWVASQK